jgi:hypothetical protein
LCQGADSFDNIGGSPVRRLAALSTGDEAAARDDGHSQVCTPKIDGENVIVHR